MRDAGRIAAAIEVLEAVVNRHAPVKTALREWAKAHRFAGSGDRAWISGLVLDGLRRRAGAGFLFGEDTPRAMALGGLKLAWGWDAAAVDAAFEGDEHAPTALSEAERAGFERTLDDAPLHVRADIPDWLEDSFQRAFGDAAAEEGAGMAARAPVDLRVNRIKTDPDKALAAVTAKLKAEPNALLTGAIRLPDTDPRAKAPPADAIPAYGKGWVEVQDLGSQLAALAAAPASGLQVLDYCAGAGGKTLALASLMENSGQIYAWDYDWRRLRAIWPRLKRAGARNVQVRDGKRDEALGDLKTKCDVVFCDAPCSGSGTWRRRPDSKWRLRAEALKRRMAEQDDVLAKASAYVKPGGRLIYVTCSVLPEENEDRVAAFLEGGAPFEPRPVLDAIKASDHLTDAGEAALKTCEGRFGAVQLTPHRAGTDGFYVCVLEKV
ncbi:MAG: RsmB/NOP family class I SAM-dependent RNA methyltransferase [Pseudomonadota bacterium]